MAAKKKFYGFIFQKVNRRSNKAAEEKVGRDVSLSSIVVVYMEAVYVCIFVRPFICLRLV